MTGKPLNDFQLSILKKLLQIQKLNNHDIAFVFDCDDRTIRRRRYEFAATGDLKKKRDVGKNAEKLKPELLQKLQAWIAAHEDALLQDCQDFLKKNFDVEVSRGTISRQLKSATGDNRPNRKSKARRFRLERDAQGRLIETELALPSESPPGEDGQQEEQALQGQTEQTEHARDEAGRQQVHYRPHEEARFEVVNGVQPRGP